MPAYMPMLTRMHRSPVCSVGTCTPDMSTPSSSCMLCLGWGPMPSGWLKLTSIPREPLPYRMAGSQTAERESDMDLLLLQERSC